jgi:antitoxin component YwqK of YwqJK toxin-antitoxin module
MMARFSNDRRRCGWIDRRLVVAVASISTFFASQRSFVTAESFPSSAARKIESHTKIIYERYSDGRVRIERKVTVDSDGNFVNDGVWREWSPDGMLIAEGRLARGRHAGRWTRWLDRDDAELLATAPFDQFEAPFVSRASFVDGQMDGDWTIVDARGRKCSRVTLESGIRAGPATLWLPDGKILREMYFVDGLPSGDLRELGGDGKLKTAASYIDGHQVMNKLSRFPESELKHVEATFLTAATAIVERDDFWHASFAKFAVQEEQVRNGAWRSWYSNGQLQCEGNYRCGRESGTFTWWHANGTHAVEGTFVDGRPDGGWTWWHANGQKAAHVQFSRGAVVGRWRHWASDGQVVERRPNNEPRGAHGRARPVMSADRFLTLPR